MTTSLTTPLTTPLAARATAFMLAATMTLAIVSGLGHLARHEQAAAQAWAQSQVGSCDRA